MITCFKDKNNKSKRNYKTYKALTTILKSIYTFVIIATTSTSCTLSLTGIGLLVIPISTASASALSIGKKVIYEKILQKYTKYKKQNENHQHTIKSFNKLNRILLQDNVFDKKEYDPLCNLFTKYVDETKHESFS